MNVEKDTFSQGQTEIRGYYEYYSSVNNSKQYARQTTVKMDANKHLQSVKHS